MNRRHWLALSGTSLASLLYRWDRSLAAEPGMLGPDPKVWSASVEKAITFLKGAQAADGSWSKTGNLGVTGVVVDRPAGDRQGQSG